MPPIENSPFAPIYGLQVITPRIAEKLGFESITIGISANTEKDLLANIARGRHPERAAWIRIGPNTYELAVKREDILR